MADIVLPKLHSAQLRALKNRGRFNALRCGRRWGKTAMLSAVTCSQAANGRRVGWFAPEYKFLAEPYREICGILQPIIASKSKTEGTIITTTGGQIDIWSLENELAGRGRKYHTVILDEIAFGKDRTTKEQWEKCVESTLIDYQGSCYALSTPKGIAEENWFYGICTDGNGQWQQFHSPSHENPHLKPAELDRLKAEMHPDVYRQEILAEFVDWSGVAFFSLDSMLDNGQPVQMPQNIDYVFAVIDTALKTGRENDGTGVVYYGVSKHFGHPMAILDWDILQIEGSLLESWLPSVYQNLEAMARETASRFGSIGCFIEDKGSGTILSQQAKRRGWAAEPIDTALTAQGKDERALSVSGYVYQGMIKFTERAYNKTKMYKGISRNHLLAQVTSFRPGDKAAAKRQDDLLDCFTYGLSIGLGNSYGY